MAFDLFSEHRSAGHHAVPVTRRQINRARAISHTLYECGDDIDFWCERLGYELVEVSLPKGFGGMLLNGCIVIPKRLKWIDKVLSIAHEIFHHEFHGSAIAFRELPTGDIDLHENQAECFAVLVAEPSLLRYDNIPQFHEESRLSDAHKRLRERLFYMVKV